MKPRSSSYFLVFVLILMLILVGISFGYSDISLKLLPILVGSAVIILALVELSKELVTITKKDSTVQEVPFEEGRGELLRLGGALGWLIGFFLCIYFLGVLIAVPLFIIVYLKFRRRSWFSAISVGAIMTAFIYTAFEFILNAPLYRGLIFGG